MATIMTTVTSIQMGCLLWFMLLPDLALPSLMQTTPTNTIMTTMMTTISILVQHSLQPMLISALVAPDRLDAGSIQYTKTVSSIQWHVHQRTCLSETPNPRPTTCFPIETRISRGGRIGYHGELCFNFLDHTRLNGIR